MEKTVATPKGLARRPEKSVSIEEMNLAAVAAAATSIGRDGKRLANPVRNSVTRMNRKHSAAELMAECDPNAPMPAGMVEWDQIVPVGLECDIEITEEDSGFVARCPNPEVSSDGKTPEEALANVREALALYFENNDRG